MAQRAQYLEPETNQSLGEAIAELRSLEDDVSESISDSDLTKAMSGHDAVHVLFGCDITDRDEIVAHFWMLFGTDLTMQEMKDINAGNEHKDYARQVHQRHKIWRLPLLLPTAASVFRRSRRMRKKWPFHDYQKFLDRGLSGLRNEFGIAL